MEHTFLEEEDEFEDAYSGSVDMDREEQRSCTSTLQGPPSACAYTVLDHVGPYSASKHPIHQAAWENNVDALRQLISGLSSEELAAMKDLHGNTPLHVASIRGSKEAVLVLLAAGCPADARSSRGWMPLMEAGEARHREVALVLGRAEMTQLRDRVRGKKQALLAQLRGLPDMCMVLSWQVASGVPGLGALLRKYAPHDTYTLWKKGSRLRVDGSLMGLRDDSPGLMPQWKRGHFSLLYDASEGGTGRAMFVNHAAKKYMDVKTAKKKMGAAAMGGAPAKHEHEQAELAAVEHEVDTLMLAQGVEQAKVRSADLRFKPAAGWLSREVREKVAGWDCKVYEASGKMIASTTFKEPWSYSLAPHTLSSAPWAAYLAAAPAPDVVLERAVNPLNPSAMGKDKDRQGVVPAAGAAGEGSKHVADGDGEEGDGDVYEGVDGDDEAAQLATLGLGPETDTSYNSSKHHDKQGPGEREGNGRRGEGSAASSSGDMTDTTHVAVLAEQEAGGQEGDTAAEGGSAQLGQTASTTAANMMARADGETDTSSTTRHAKAGGRYDQAALARKLHEAAVASCMSRPRPHAAEAAAAAGPKYGPPGSAAKKARRFSGRCWMAADFPLSLKQLLPLLEVMGSANKVLARVGRFMAKYGDMHMFPVQVQVPLLLSVYVEVGVKGFSLLPTTGQAGSNTPPTSSSSSTTPKKASRLWGSSSSSKAPAALVFDPGCLADDFYLVPPHYVQSKVPSVADMGGMGPTPGPTRAPAPAADSTARSPQPQ